MKRMARVLISPELLSEVLRFGENNVVRLRTVDSYSTPQFEMVIEGPDMPEVAEGAELSMATPWYNQLDDGRVELHKWVFEGKVAPCPTIRGGEQMGVTAQRHPREGGA